MVARLTVGKKKYAEVVAQMWAVIGQADALRTELSNCVEEDSAAFEELMAAMKLPKDDEIQLKIRAEAIEKATIGAIRVPLKVARLSLEAMKLALLVCQKGNTNAMSDGATGAALAKAALTGAGYNIRINCQGLRDPGLSDQYFSDLQELEKQADEIQKAVAQILIERGGFNIG
jgi:formiminotetrahydrofolate cyclodeaminase